MSTELRFFEQIDEGGTLRRVLQSRTAPYVPWTDVPVVTLEQQGEARQQREEDAQALGSYG